MSTISGEETSWYFAKINVLSFAIKTFWERIPLPKKDNEEYFQMPADAWRGVGGGGGGRSPNPTLGSTLGFWAVPARPWDEEEAMLVRGESERVDKWEGGEERKRGRRRRRRSCLNAWRWVEQRENDDSHVLTSVASGLWPPKQRDCNFCRGATLFSSKVEHSWWSNACDKLDGSVQRNSIQTQAHSLFWNFQLDGWVSMHGQMCQSVLHDTS